MTSTFKFPLDAPLLSGTLLKQKDFGMRLSKKFVILYPGFLVFYDNAERWALDVKGNTLSGRTGAIYLKNAKSRAASPDTTKHRYALSVSAPEVRNKRKDLVLIASDDKEREAWIVAITNATPHAKVITQTIIPEDTSIKDIAASLTNVQGMSLEVAHEAKVHTMPVKEEPQPTRYNHEMQVKEILAGAGDLPSVACINEPLTPRSIAHAGNQPIATASHNDQISSLPTALSYVDVNINGGAIIPPPVVVVRAASHAENLEEQPTRPTDRTSSISSLDRGYRQMAPQKESPIGTLNWDDDGLESGDDCLDDSVCDSEADVWFDRVSDKEFCRLRVGDRPCDTSSCYLSDTSQCGEFGCMLNTTRCKSAEDLSNRIHMLSDRGSVDLTSSVSSSLNDSTSSAVSDSADFDDDSSDERCAPMTIMEAKAAKNNSVIIHVLPNERSLPPASNSPPNCSTRTSAPAGGLKITEGTHSSFGLAFVSGADTKFFMEKKGFLYKLNENGRSWNPIYLTIYPGYFCCYKNSSSQKPRRIVKLRNSSVASTATEKRPYQFTVHAVSTQNSKTDWVFAAHGQKAMEEWITAFQLAGQKP